MAFNIIRIVRIGPCKLYCADAYKVLEKLPPGAICTDPPYGMAWNGNNRRFSGGSNTSQRLRGVSKTHHAPIIGDAQGVDLTFVEHYKEAVVWGYNHLALILGPGGALVWIKRQDTAFGSFLSDAEIAWVKGRRGVYCRRDTSLKAKPAARVHPAQKPVGILTWCLSFLKAPLVIDPFMGVGTTGVACLQQGKRFIGIEIEPHYFDLACQRIAAAQAELCEATAIAGV